MVMLILADKTVLSFAKATLHYNNNLSQMV